MRRPTLLALPFLFAAVLLLAVPAETLDGVRLAFCGALLGLAERTVPGAKTEGEDESDRISLRRRIRELTDLVAVKDAELAGLHTRLDHLRGREYLPVHVRITPAAVVGLDTASPHRLARHPDSVLIDAGGDAGVSAGDGVVQGHVLAGRVARTAPTASRVLLLSHPGCLVPARAGGKRELCAVRGLGEGRAEALFYRPDPPVHRGETVVTSGLLGRLERDLLVGTLAQDPVESEEPRTWRAEIRIAADLAGLEDVLVIRAEGAAGLTAHGRP